MIIKRIVQHLLAAIDFLVAQLTKTPSAPQYAFDMTVMQRIDSQELVPVRVIAGGQFLNKQRTH